MPELGRGPRQTQGGAGQVGAREDRAQRIGGGGDDGGGGGVGFGRRGFAGALVSGLYRALLLLAESVQERAGVAGSRRSRKQGFHRGDHLLVCSNVLGRIQEIHRNCVVLFWVGFIGLRRFSFLLKLFLSVIDGYFALYVMVSMKQ